MDLSEGTCRRRTVILLADFSHPLLYRPNVALLEIHTVPDSCRKVGVRLVLVLRSRLAGLVRLLALELCGCCSGSTGTLQIIHARLNICESSVDRLASAFGNLDVPALPLRYIELPIRSPHRIEREAKRGR